MRKELLTYQDPKSPVSEVFRTLRTNIQFMNTNRKLKTLLVTSTFPEEGKSWVTANLAVTFAQAGKKVILVDADMRKGRQYKIFDILPKPGLSNYLSNMDADNMEVSDINIVNYIQATGVDNLHVLVAGNVPPNPSELLVSTRMRELLKELKEMCDLVIIDGTPCGLVTDSIILSRFVDSTIIVTAQKETKKDALQRITKNIQNVGGRIAGVIVNKVDSSAKKYNQSYYYGSISSTSLVVAKPKHRKDKFDFSLGNMFKGSGSRDDYEESPDNKDSINENENRVNYELNEETDNHDRRKDERDLEIEKLVKSMEAEIKNAEKEQPVQYEPQVNEPEQTSYQPPVYEEQPVQYEPQVNKPEQITYEQPVIENQQIPPKQVLDEKQVEETKVEEVQKTAEQLQEEKKDEINNIVNNYVQNELSKHN